MSSTCFNRKLRHVNHSLQLWRGLVDMKQFNEPHGSTKIDRMVA